MRRHPKAPAVGSTLGIGSSRIRCGGAFATPGASGGSKGSGAPAIPLGFALLAALVLCLAFGAGSAWAKTYGPGVPASFCSGTGALGGECGELKGVAVDTSTGEPTSGHIYVVDQGYNRIDQFAPNGAFVRSFGADVVASGPGDKGTTSFEICEAGVDVCKGGVTTASIGGAIGAAKSIAVDPATHVVYVVSAGARLAWYNGSTGAFLAQTEGISSNAPSVNVGTPEKFSNLTGAAIDLSDPLQHYLYVGMNLASGSTKVDKFKIGASGIVPPAPPSVPSPYVCQITGTAVDASVNFTECGNPSPGSKNDNPAHKNGAFEGLAPGIGQIGGSLAVDASGNLFILETQTRQTVSEFSKAGNFVTQFVPTQPRPEAVATLPNGSLLVALGGSASGTGGSRIQEYNPASPASPLGEFGLGTIGGSVGIATQGEDVFVSDRTNKKVFKFVVEPEAPTVVTGTATELSKFKATLNGSVNPNRANVTDCHFEYLTDSAYQANAPATRFAGAATAICTPAAPGSNAAPVAVNAKVSGLQFGTEYHVRLLATNAKGTPPSSNEITFSTTLVNKPEAITTAGATLIAQTTSKVAGKVNPNEVQVTDCHFKYLTDAAYQANLPADRFAGAATAPCVPDAATIGAGGSLVDVSASLTGLVPDATYHFLLKATNGDGTSANSDDKTFATLPTAPAVSDAEAEPGQIAAKVKAEVNPNSGTNDSTLSGCRIDYGTTPAYGSTQPCVPNAATIGAGESPVPVSFSLTGLNPSTPYFYRVVAANAGGSDEETGTFLTLAPNAPTAFNDGATEGLGNTFTMQGRVDPEGIALTDCHFAYGPTAEYGKTAPCTPSAAGLGSGDSQVSVTAATEPLEPNTTYHYRLFAANVRGSTLGKDRILTTGAPPADSCANAEIRTEQGIEIQQLPDCLALEQVSPSKKGNQSAQFKSGRSALSPDGSRVLFNSTATLGSCPRVNGIAGDGFIAIRDSEGWGSECVTRVEDDFYSSVGGISFDPELTSWVQLILTTSEELKYYAGGLGVPRTALSPALVNLSGSSGPGFNGASTDHSHVYLYPEGSREGAFLPGDPVPTGQGEDPNLYVTRLDSGTPSLQLAAKDSSEKVWGGNCGARLGGMEDTTGGNLNLQNGERNQGAISADGTRVYFSTRPSQPTNTTPGGPITGACTEANKKRIMLREETPGGVQIKELIASECNRVTPDPACSSTDGDDVYQGASVDQKLVYFTTTRQLDNADLDSNASHCDRTTAVSGCDLYLYDEAKPEGEQLIDVSAGESTATTPGIGASVRNSITAISADGTHAYFVARTVLSTDPNPSGAVAQSNANNLYLYDHSGEDLSFVGTLANGDAGSLFGGEAGWENDAFTVPVGGTDSEGEEVGGDGHLLLFNSAAQLDPADTDSATDLYRYDAEEGSLELLSKAAPGGTDDGAFGAITSSYLGEAPGTDYADNGRWVSEDGETVVFATKEALFPGDTNGVEDSFLWREGQTYHLPGTTRSSPAATQILPLVSRDGSTIAYHSTKRLTSSDIDSVEDVYVLRPGGGFATSAVADCEGEACQGAPSTASDEIDAYTGSGGSSGNIIPPSKKCPKGKRKVRRGGKVHCVKPAKHKKKSAHNKKRTSSNQGGQK